MTKNGLSLIRIFPYVGRIVSVFFSNLQWIGDSVQIRENAGTILSICGEMRIRESPYFGVFRQVLLIIFSQILDLRENMSFFSSRKLFVREYMNCFTARKLRQENKWNAKFDAVKVYRRREKIAFEQQCR